jgi:hypothetical protein
MSKKLLRKILDDMQVIRILQSQMSSDIKNLKEQGIVEDWNNIDEYIRLADEAWKNINDAHKKLYNGGLQK